MVTQGAGNGKPESGKPQSRELETAHLTRIRDTRECIDMTKPGVI
jgi:hypothetical protein